MKVLIFIFALLCEGLAFTLHEVVRRDVGPKDCAHGPEYWCQNLQTAKSCGAVKHCIQDVWQHMKLPQDDSDICETCKKMVQEARDQLESNETQEEIRQVLEGTCKIYFPIKALANECIKFVDQFIPELIEMLVSRMDPQLVCATCGLCNVESIKYRLTAEKPTYHLPTPSDCQDCKKFMQDMITDVQSASEEEVRQKLLDVCTHLPQYATACRLFVIENINQIYQFLKTQASSEEMCQLIGMCDETTNIPTINSLVELFILKTDPDPECQFCEQLVLYLKNLITANSTEEEVKNLLLGICHSLGSLSGKCEEFVNDNFQEIYDFLTDELDPQMICTALGLCNNNLSSPLVSLTASKPPSKIQKQELTFSPNPESNDVNSAPFASNSDKIHIKVPFSKTIQVPPKPEDMQLPETRLFPQALLPKSNIGCALCEYVLHDLQNILMDNKTTAAIKSAFDRVCGLLPKTLTDQCVDFINQYGDAILALIAQEIDPSQVCVALKLCDPPKKMNPADIQLPPSRLMPNALIKSYKSAETCQLCQYVMGIIHNMLKENNTKEAIENALNKACLELPKTMQQKCTKFMQQYGDKILTLLQEVDPSIICAMLKLCPASKQGLVPIKELKMGKCDICQMVVDYIDKLLEEQTIEEDISKVLEKVCGIVPQSAREQCDTIIETYGPYLLQLIAQFTNSKQICQAIDLCDKPAGEVQLLGGNKCTFGPAYWCQSKIHAKACNAEQHCKEKVWKN